jgi:hypothetical protein
MASVPKTGVGTEQNPGLDSTSEPGTPTDGRREVSYEHSQDLAEILASLNASLLISTYQAGKLIVVGCQQSRLALSFQAHPACVLTRSAQVTGEIQAHEMAWAGGELWIVNTLFSCLCTLHPHYSFVPRWRPPFFRSLAPEDRCHLNGLAVQDGKPKFRQIESRKLRHFPDRAVGGF